MLTDTAVRNAQSKDKSWPCPDSTFVSPLANNKMQGNQIMGSKGKLFRLINQLH